MRIVRTRLLFAMVILLGMTRVISAGAQESYYKGKSIRLIVGLAPGGGYDLYSTGHCPSHGQAYPRQSGHRC